MGKSSLISNKTITFPEKPKYSTDFLFFDKEIIGSDTNDGADQEDSFKPQSNYLVFQRAQHIGNKVSIDSFYVLSPLKANHIKLNNNYFTNMLKSQSLWRFSTCNHLI